MCDLVAHHSGSRYVAAVRGLGAELAEFTYYTENPVADALTMPDQTVGPDGQAMTLEQRLSDMLTRHGRDSPMPAPPPNAGTTFVPPQHASPPGSPQPEGEPTTRLAGLHLTSPSGVAQLPAGPRCPPEQP